MALDTAFQVSSSNLRFGFGCTRELGMDLKELGALRVMVLMDPALVDLHPGHAVLESLRESSVP